ncbi:hypothetical protein BGZ46_007638 [Entomortierella lignicola]|nr:hypothetical protein BGZ46_007638 [Entomortierella lignicola]
MTHEPPKILRNAKNDCCGDDGAEDVGYVGKRSKLGCAYYAVDQSNMRFDLQLVQSGGEGEGDETHGSRKYRFSASSINGDEEEDSETIDRVLLDLAGDEVEDTLEVLVLQKAEEGGETDPSKGEL